MRPWSKDRNLLGYIGESLYSAMTGIPMNEDCDLGDGGEDFPGVNVKAVGYWNTCYLCAGGAAPLKAPFYFLVSVNLTIRRARACGYATLEMVRAAPFEDRGTGACHWLPERQLIRSLPPV